MDYNHMARYRTKGRTTPDKTAVLAAAIRDKDDVARMFIEALPYTRVGVLREEGSGLRALNQILDILVEMGYEDDLKDEGNGQIRYVDHPKFGDWVDGSFRNENMFMKVNVADLWECIS